MAKIFAAFFFALSALIIVSYHYSVRPEYRTVVAQPEQSQDNSLQHLNKMQTGIREDLTRGIVSQIYDAVDLDSITVKAPLYLPRIDVEPEDRPGTFRDDEWKRLDKPDYHGSDRNVGKITDEDLGGAAKKGGSMAAKRAARTAGEALARSSNTFIRAVGKFVKGVTGAVAAGVTSFFSGEDIADGTVDNPAAQAELERTKEARSADQTERNKLVAAEKGKKNMIKDAADKAEKEKKAAQKRYQAEKKNAQKAPPPKSPAIRDRDIRDWHWDRDHGRDWDRGLRDYLKDDRFNDA